MISQDCDTHLPTISHTLELALPHMNCLNLASHLWIFFRLALAIRHLFNFRFSSWQCLDIANTVWVASKICVQGRRPNSQKYPCLLSFCAVKSHWTQKHFPHHLRISCHNQWPFWWHPFLKANCLCRYHIARTDYSRLAFEVHFPLSATDLI